MRNNLLNVAIFLAVATGFTFLWLHADKNWFPKPPAKAKKDPAAEEEELRKKGEEEARVRAEKDAKRLAVGAVAGTVALAAEPVAPPKPVEPPKVAALPKPADPATLVALGNETFFNQVLLTTRGGGVQQVILPKFDEADRLGREVKVKDEHGNPTRKAVPLYLIPGMVRPRGKFLREDFAVPDLKPGPVADPAALAEPSFALFHYPTPDDKYPDPHLGEVNWKVVAEARPDDGDHAVTFEAELGEPHLVKIRKTYTLGRKDYHVGLKVELERLPGGQKGKGQLRLQLVGPHGLPIEGEWYTSTYRVALIGSVDGKGTPRRQYEDAATIAARRGGEAVQKGENTFKYMAVATQYFASAVAVDDTADGPAKNPWAYARATTELPFDKLSNPNQPYFDDITVRAATDTIDLAPGEKLTHSYLIYNGPAKVRLLGLEEGDRAVDPKLVERYQEKLGLQTITDFRSDTWLGRFANAIYWVDLVIAFTNLMHWLLASIHSVIPGWAMSIVVLTVMVRLLLFVPSKKQTQMNLKMMEVQKRLAPQFEELKKKYADNPHAYNQAKMRLMMANGVSPFAALGGCLLLLAQMPIMMGLYFCLQESVFFRLEPFLWINNLAAPDMLFWWGENIPVISSPNDLGGILYLGPYFNLLPLLAVGLMMWQQAKMMPPPVDEQAQQQRMMMKIMMIMMAVLFYKVAAGLALYFIIGTVWGLIERRFIPKADDKPADAAGAAAGATTTVQTSAGPVAVPKAKGLFGRIMDAARERMEEMKRQADEQSRRQIRNDKGEPDAGPNPNQNRRDDRRDRKKKRRK